MKPIWVYYATADNMLDVLISKCSNESVFWFINGVKPCQDFIGSLCVVQSRTVEWIGTTSDIYFTKLPTGCDDICFPWPVCHFYKPYLCLDFFKYHNLIDFSCIFILNWLVLILHFKFNFCVLHIFSWLLNFRSSVKKKKCVWLLVADSYDPSYFGELYWNSEMV